MTLKILLAEDQAIVRAGFRMLIDAEADMEVVAEVSSGEHAVREARRLRPDVVLMDIRMPGMDGIRATELIVADPGAASRRVLVLTTFELDEYVFGALRAGASGFLLKGGEPAELLHAIRTVAGGDALLAPSITRRLIDAYTARPEPRPAPAAVEQLTDREREVMTHVAAGLTNAEIARALNVSPLTAKTHISSILGKLGVRDRVQLVVLAYETGLVAPAGEPS
jgi:DNA-binding NarL/FixJ family response regulator